MAAKEEEGEKNLFKNMKEQVLHPKNVPACGAREPEPLFTARKCMDLDRDRDCDREPLRL